MKKKAQITIFIILGIILLIFLGVFLYIKTITIKSQAETEKEEITPSQFQINPIENYIESCIKMHAGNTIKSIYAYGGHTTPSHPTTYNGMQLSSLCYINPRGFLTTDYVPKEQIQETINDSVKYNFLACLDDFKVFKKQGIEVTGNEFTVETKINYYSGIIIKVNYPIIIKRENSESKLSDFFVQFPYEFGNIYRIVREVIVASVIGGFTDAEFNELVNTLSPYYPTLTITRYLISENTYAYKISSTNDLYDFYFACTITPIQISLSSSLEELGGIHFMFGVDTGQDFTQVKDTGVNLIHDYGYKGRVYLDKAQAAGLYVLYDLKFLIHDQLRGHSPQEQWNIWTNSKAEIEDKINEVKDHPALYGYYTLDEPNLEGAGIPHDLQQDIYDFVKSIDPNHKVAFAIAGGPGGLGYASVNFNSLDILIPDTYTYGAEGGLASLRWAGSHLREYLDDNGISIPVVFTIQASSEPGGAWQGHVRDQIDVVLQYNLATGGIGMWAWNLEGGPGSNSQVRDEIKNAWP